MVKKLRQVTDNIHGTIYLSEFESRMISTPFFYRLHDVYQSSTVYMTFPANRTKRYEHCLGTMELAGQMFYYSITNASTEVRQEFIGCLNHELQKVIAAFKARTKIKQAFYGEGTQAQDFLSRVFPASRCTYNTVRKNISQEMRDGSVSDLALDHQKVCFFDLLPDKAREGKDDAEEVLLAAFLYQCALEAIRIAALFHDVGHPPYSHILEATMVELYRRCEDDETGFDETKAAFLKEMLGSFLKEETVSQLLIEAQEATEEESGGKRTPDLHEAIGLKMLQAAFKNVIAERFEDISRNSPNAANKMTCALYEILVAEFTFAILQEKKPVFAAMHRMLDGPVDVDRLDYIVRDTQNAGINWGLVPYKRLIDSVKLVSLGEKRFSTAFPEKMMDDIDDILVERYKVFGRINFHHRSSKTAKVLQKTVYMLAEDYLRTASPKEGGQDDSICPEIENLWGALGGTIGQTEGENKAAKWNDSWLISALHSVLIKLSDPATCEELISDERPDRTPEKLRLLNELLGEVLLNHKHYFSLLKRQSDAINLMEEIMLRAGITEEKLDAIIGHEYHKMAQESGEGSEEAKDSLYRIHMLQNEIAPKADFEQLGIFFLGGSCADLIENVLAQEMQDEHIKDYIVSPNAVRYKRGISFQNEKDTIYLYTPEGTHYRYDIRNTLLPLLQAYRTANLWLNVYINPGRKEDVGRTLKNLLEKIKDAAGDRIRDNMEEWFHIIKLATPPEI